MIRSLIAGSLRVFSGSVARWQGCAPEPVQRVYFANHTSNLDGPVLWASLPPQVRVVTRMVGAKDYWSVGRLRPYLACHVFNAVLIERKKPTPECNPLDDMINALGERHSLILFPEGGRQTSPEPQPFKPGLFHLAKKRPDVQLVPVWMENLNRILPKGEILPVPVLGSVTFGTPIKLEQGETKPDFLVRAREMVLSLRQ
ncbi:lysophospholipid acyltransferase family protein [Prosthecobacter sp.]|uniref:lysophospholipid acyltransferase family protein n=1 Tax=Prosthecobacter sp. TaxID=1965333 RepID=UPI002ABABD89|nr:lysophospholipid acyltransferase family protein [Prosthecobacter sp.]MDZ4401803.1 lysophospholipid acyltransferase family protein [Prosthecobacter sp.]